jgi:Resolvase, N terminal domain/Recombinase
LASSTPDTDKVSSVMALMAASASCVERDTRRRRWPTVLVSQKKAGTVKTDTMVSCQLRMIMATMLDKKVRDAMVDSMTRAGIWIRVSTGEQDEANQIPDLERYCANKPYAIVARYELHDRSASKGEQEQAMQQVLADLKSGHIKVLVIWHSDRLDRREPVEALLFLRDVKRAGGQIESTEEGLLDEKDLRTLVTAYTNHEKSEHLRRQVGIAYERIDANDAFRWKVPFGFTLKGPKYDKHLVPTDTGREYIPQIFERYISGASLSELAWWLDSLKIRFKKDRKTGELVLVPWWPMQVARLLRNPVYVGYYTKGEGLAFLDSPNPAWLHQCEALIDTRTFRRANEALADRERKQRGPRGNPENYAMCRGATRCPRCGASMTRINSYGKWVKPEGQKGYYQREDFYRCAGSGARSREPGTRSARRGCGNQVPMAWVDAAVNVIIADMWHRPVMLPTLIRGRDYDQELEAIGLELRRLPIRGLDRREEQAERERLWAEEDRIKDLPVEEDYWDEVATGEVYSDLWAGLSKPERGAWLVAHGFRVEATRELVKVVQDTPKGPRSGKVSLPLAA